MFKTAFDRKRRVLWMSFHGAFIQDDFHVLERLNEIIASIDKPIDCVFDYSDTTGAGMTFREEFMKRAQRPHAMANMRRIVISSNPAVLNLAQTFAAAQVFIGSSSLEIKKTPEEAHQMFGPAPLDLQPIELDALRELLRG